MIRPKPLQGADIKGVLRPALAGALAVDSPCAPCGLALSREAICASVNKMPVCATLRCERSGAA